MRFKRLDVDLPMPIYDRMVKALEDTQKKGLLPATTTPREFLLATVFTNGLAAVEADLYNRERQSSLVITPQEAKEAAERLRGLKR